MTNSLYYPVKNAGPLNLEWMPLPKTFIYNAGSNRSASSEAQMLSNTTDKQILVFLLLLVEWFLGPVLKLWLFPCIHGRTMQILLQYQQELSMLSCIHEQTIGTSEIYLTYHGSFGAFSPLNIFTRSKIVIFRAKNYISGNMDAMAFSKNSPE